MKPIHYIFLFLIIFVLGMVAGVNLERCVNREKAISFGIKWERDHPNHPGIFTL